MVVTCGISINFHYCMGKLKSVTMAHAQSDHCDDCGMASKKSACCHDDVHWFKINGNHQTFQAGIDFQVPIFELAPAEHCQLTPPVYYTPHTAVNNNSPPVIETGTSLNILHCVFRI